jgi:hypothetical protein
MQSGAEAPLSLHSLYADGTVPGVRRAAAGAVLSAYKLANASVEGCFRLQARDFVLHQQLATFECYDL